MNEKNSFLPLGKLPFDLLERLLHQAPVSDPRVLLKPGIGLDCAIVDAGANLLVFKSDPITFATEEIGWYLIQINANDIATTGAVPRWFLLTLLLPQGKTTPALAEKICEQVYSACRSMDISVIGGHTEITHGLDRPIALGTMIGEVSRESLVTPKGCRPGDRVLLTKGVPIEATALLAREFPQRLAGSLSPAEIEQAQQFLHSPGISVLEDARLAAQAGHVTAMHDPTEGGLAAALWELAEASGNSIFVDLASILIPPLSARVCQVFGLDPLAAIASGALLLTAEARDAANICSELKKKGIPCAEIGQVEPGPSRVSYQTAGERLQLPKPNRDEIAKVFDE